MKASKFWIALLAIGLTAIMNYRARNRFNELGPDFHRAPTRFVYHFCQLCYFSSAASCLRYSSIM